MGGGGSRGGRDGGGRDDFDHFRFSEHDKGPGYHRDIDFHEDRSRRGPPVMERERFREEDRFVPPVRRRHDIFEESTPSEVANRALAPYRRKSVIDKDINLDIDINSREERAPPPARARPARPGFMRRQSSLDTFDRRPLPRYHGGEIERYERDEVHDYRLPPNVPIPLPIREHRRRSPPRRFEDDFEEIRYDDRRGRGREEEAYREVEVHREKSRVRRSKSVAAKSTRSSSISSFEEIQPARATFGKKGRTRMPKRLVKKQAVIELGYPYEEEDDFIVITRALEKEHIDEVIKISENYKEAEKTTYVYEEKVEEFQPPPPPPPPESVAPPPPPSVLHVPPPPPQSVYAPPPPQSVYAPSHHHHDEYVNIETTNQHLVRHNDYRSERDIKEEIRALEDERRMLKYERETDYEIIERRDPRREVIRVDKDRKGKRDRPNPKLVAAMMSTLT